MYVKDMSRKTHGVLGHDNGSSCSWLLRNTDELSKVRVLAQPFVGPQFGLHGCFFSFAHEGHGDKLWLSTYLLS
jgi:hypothetical protein